MSSGGAREGSGRPSPWRNKQTIVIRVPAILVEQVLDHARMLDSGQLSDNVQNQNDNVQNQKIDKLTAIQQFINSKRNEVEKPKSARWENAFKLMDKIQQIIDEV